MVRTIVRTIVMSVWGSFQDARKQTVLSVTDRTSIVDMRCSPIVIKAGIPHPKTLRFPCELPHSSPSRLFCVTQMPTATRMVAPLTPTAEAKPAVLSPAAGATTAMVLARTDPVENATAVPRTSGTMVPPAVQRTRRRASLPGNTAAVPSGKLGARNFHATRSP